MTSAAVTPQPSAPSAPPRENSASPNSILRQSGSDPQHSVLPAAQLDFPLSDPAPDASIATLIAMLDQELTWLTAAEILVKLNEPVNDSKKRQLRELANASNGKIISGQRGYKHIRHASLDEITHAAHWLRHQAKQMDTRAAEILHQYHQLPHNPK